MTRTCTAAPTTQATPLTGRQTLNALLSASQDEFYSSLQHTLNHLVAQQNTNTTSTEREPVVCNYLLMKTES